MNPHSPIPNPGLHCPHFAAARCRSCGWIQRGYAEQLADKQALAEARIRGSRLRWLPPQASALSGFRNKAKMAVGGSIESPILGLVDLGDHAVDLADCLLYPPALHAAFEPLRDFIRAARITPYSLAERRGELKYLLLTIAPSGELGLRFVLRSREPLSRIEKHLPSLRLALPLLCPVSVNLQPEHKAVLEGETEILLPGPDSLRMVLNGIPLHLKPRSFFQTHTALAAALYAQAARWVADLKPDRLLDLYCGVGGFGLHCAPHAIAVIGREISPEAIASAQRSADELGLSNARFEVADASAGAAVAGTVDAIVVNPPRRGIGAELCAAIEASTAQTLIYSSCNVDSLAADLARLPSFAPVEAQVLDLFPHTSHFETLVLLRRQAA
ncbi:methyltransferase domain-containing protein [Aquimonas voraii]|uniref:23S rRNA m(5)U-747 methyltransferase n=1 Tax=Aquimonas voraii TaxID=265719 RepID=A0A1G6S609_9GAMM|nr:methyltransferase domain-containing protein [Aquimonas voraii]SDD12111.1 23S rRNA m(5)U-747 methyltransferase [Aquimonas voraii]